MGRMFTAIVLIVLPWKSISAIDLDSATTRFFAVENFSYADQGGKRTFYNAHGFYSSAVGSQPAQVSILPRISLDAGSPKVFGVDGRQKRFSRINHTRNIGSINIPLGYSGRLPNRFEGAAIASAIAGNQLELFDHWPLASQEAGAPYMSPGVRFGPLDAEIHRATKEYIDARARRSEDFAQEWDKVTAEIASMDGLEIRLLIDGDVIAERQLAGSAIFSSGVLPALIVREPTLSIYNRIREGNFEVELVHKFLDRAKGTISASYDYARMLDAYVEQSRQAFSRSKSSGFKFFGLGSRKKHLSQSIREADQRSTVFNTTSNTNVAMVDAPKSLIDQFESSFFPSLTKARAKDLHFQAKQVALDNGQKKLAELHGKYANALEEANEALEADAMAEAATALSSGNYALFLAKGVRFHNNQSSTSDSWNRIITQNVDESGERIWVGSSTRSVVRSVTVLVTPSKREDRSAWVGFCDAINWIENVPGPYGYRRVELIVPTCIIAGSPMHNAGIQQGDKIISIDGRVIRSYDGLRNVFSAKNPGDTVRFRLLSSNGSTRFVQIEVGEGHLARPKISLLD